MKLQFNGPRALIVTSLTLSLIGCKWFGSGDNGDNSTFRAPTSVAIADLNGDGLPDLALSTSIVRSLTGENQPGLASVFLQSSSSHGSFQKPTDTGVGTSPSAIAVGDLTGTGTKDLVVANFNSGTLSVLLQTAPGSGKYQAVTSYTTGGSPNDVQIADVNGDGKMDLVVADNAAVGRILILLQDTTNPGHFLNATPMAAPNAASGVVVGDLNGDVGFW